MTFDELTVLMPGVEQASQMTTAWWLAHQVRQLALDFTIASPICVEVGTWCGFTAAAMAHAGGLVVCVDTFDGRDEQMRQRAAELGGSSLERFLANGLALTSGRMIAVVGKSPEIARLLPAGCAHLIFVDADHSKEAVTADLDAWGERVKARGVLCGHDCRQKDVRDAVNAYATRHGWPLVTDGPDSTWWMRRPA